MATFTAGDIVTATQMNAFAIRYEASGVVGSVVTIAPAGTITTFRYILVAAWNTTGGVQIANDVTRIRAPSGASFTMTDGTNTLQVAFPADGSITVQRTAGSITCEVHLIAI
jgi:hypothetical protein